MSAHTLSVGLWIPVETLHSVLATTTALVITCLNHIGREEPWMGEERGRKGGGGGGGCIMLSVCLHASCIVIVKSVSMGMHKLYYIVGI